jgi:hypothetical protein
VRGAQDLNVGASSTRNAIVSGGQPGRVEQAGFVWFSALVKIFRRPPDTPSSAPDTAFPYWSSDQAQRFRALVRAAFAEAGVEATVYADYAEDAGGRKFGLGNLAAACHSDSGGERAWRKIVERHVRTILADMDGQSPFETIPTSGIFAATYLRLMPAGDVLPNMNYARLVAPDLAEVFNLDLPATVAYFTDERVSSLGYEALREAGLSNLSAVRVDKHETLKRNGGTVEVLLGESVFTASLLLVFEQVLARYGLRADPDLGAFVGVPNRHQLDFHVVADAHAIQSLNILAAFTAAGYRDAAGVLSPNVYWWRPSGMRRISTLTPDGPRIDVDAELQAVLDTIVRR